MFLLSRALNVILQASGRSPGVPVRGVFATQEGVSGQQGVVGVCAEGDFVTTTEANS